MRNRFLGAIIGGSIALTIGWLSVSMIGGNYGITTVLLLLVGTTIGYALGHMKGRE